VSPWSKTMEAFKVAVGRRDGQRQVALLRAMADVAGGGAEVGAVTRPLFGST